jgi:aminocarboxymuconate-semialdehyde decarboxylase
MRVIDTHFHWYPRSHLERMGAREGYPRAERDGEGYRYYFNNGRSHISLPAVWYNLDAGLAAAEEAGPETIVVGTTGVLSGLLDQLPAPDAIEIAAEYNEELARAQRDHEGRFYGTACIPLGETGTAVSLMEHAVTDLGLRGVNLPPVTGNDPIDAPRLEPFYTRAEELGVPLIVHPTDIVFDEVLSGYGSGLQRSLGRLVDSSVTILRLIFSGVMERHPGLKIIHTHAGGLLPYQAGRIDKNAQIAELPEPPSSYLKRIYTDTVAPQELTVRTALEFYGPEHVMYGTDYPCWSPKKALAVLSGVALTQPEEAMLWHGNAETVLGIRAE